MKQPHEHQLGLRNDRLSIIAKALLDVYHNVQGELASNLDDNYTRGTTTFGRQKNRLIQLSQSDVYDWLDLRTTSNDLTCAIDGIPFRFFSDDHEKPKKPGFWRRNEQDNLFPIDKEDPIIWRFVVEKPFGEVDEASVYFLGFNADQQLVCEWKYADSIRVLKSTDNTRHEPVDTPEPNVGLPKSNAKNTDTGTNPVI